MTLIEGKFAGAALAALTLSVGANLLLQEKPLASKMVTSSLGQRASDVFGLGSATRVIQNDGDAINAAEIVRGVQRELNARGYEAGQPDGMAGLQTRAAILAYEFDYGLILTATPSQDLLSRIVLGTSSAGGARPAPSGAVAHEALPVIEFVEQALAANGYQTGKDKGTISEQTARAIREFELDQKLPESGRISGPLMSRLLKLQSGAQSAMPVAKAVEQKGAEKTAETESGSAKPSNPPPRTSDEVKAKAPKPIKTGRAGKSASTTARPKT